jgi:16S rRNA (uracil1498-N3)-methyltransferase
MLRSVLRLSPGAAIAVLPDDGTLIECELLPKCARPIRVHHPDTEPKLRITLAQALPKGDRMEQIVRSCTEIGVARFLLFSSDRTVVRWDEGKYAEKLRRLQAIAREAAELSFRTRLPAFERAAGLADVLKRYPDAVVLSESEQEMNRLEAKSELVTLVVGPEGGWSPKEIEMIRERGVTLGPRVLRADHAGFAAAAALLIGH